MTRAYQGPASVRDEYDAWTADGVLERYWGEHIHHGYYPAGRHQAVDFGAAKVDLIDRLLAWAGVARVRRGLDVGCGVGGTTRSLARRFGAEVMGITLSPAQAERALELTPPDLPARFEVADALALPYEEATFDLVWSCESGEHMPDKQRFFSEMVRVLAPGGILVLATWCRRDEPPSLSSRERTWLDTIYREWALPPFVPLERYRSIAEADGRLTDIRCDDWSRYTAPTWSHQIVLGLKDLPWLARRGRRVLLRTLRDAWAVRSMIAGYRTGAVRYGLLRATRRET